jgi:hypothetical protein
VLTFSACNLVQKEPNLSSEGDSSVVLGFSVDKSKTPNTKADYSAISELVSTTANPQFRGLSELRLLPFFTGQGVRVPSGASSNGYAQQMPGFTTGIFPGTQSYIYKDIFTSLPVGTTAVLAYGRAPRIEAATEREEKRLNGSVLEEGWDWQPVFHSTRDLKFLPEPIYNDADCWEVASDLAAILSGIARETFSIHYPADAQGFYPEGDAQLSLSGVEEGTPIEEAFQSFVNQSAPFPASGFLVKKRLNAFRSALLAVPDSDKDTDFKVDNRTVLHSVGGDPIKWSELYDGLRNSLIEAINTALSGFDANLSEYPSNLGLPAGSAMAIWGGAQFLPVTEGLDKYLPIGSFCYMPPLYYYVNSTLSTAYDGRVTEKYETATNWSDLLALYDVGKIVTRKTHAVALDNPLEYGCAMLYATVKSSFDPGTDVFPLKGILVGGQYPLQYDFTPIADEDQDGVILEECFTYDTYVGAVTLSTTPSDPIRTLVLPTLKGKEVYFFLEFQNGSSSEINGVDGKIPVGGRFYLVGKMNAPTEQNIADGNDRVFMADHFTKLDCTVKSLDNAYLGLPRLGTPELVIGVEIQMNWVFSPGSSMIME